MTTTTTTTPTRRRPPALVRALLALIAVGAGLGILAVTALFSLNLFINFGLPLVLNLQPERMRITYSFAWTWMPGAVQVRDLQIVAQGPLDQWVINVDRATAVIELEPLLHRTFAAHTLRATGGSFRYRVRKPEAEGTPVPADANVAATDANPPIPGLTNPPSPAPENLYPVATKFWLVQLHDIDLVGLREVWLGDFRFVGDAHAVGDFSYVERSHLAVDNVVLDVADGQVTLGAAPVVSTIHGRVNLVIGAMNPLAHAGLDALATFTLRIAVKGAVENLSFLEVYLREAPWVKLEGGEGDLAIDVGLDQGRLLNGSSLLANVHGLDARWFDYVAHGDSEIHFTVTEESGQPKSNLAVNFIDYAITRDGAADTLVEGAALHVTASSPHVAVDEPFSQVTLQLDLPDALVKDFSVYNRYLPRTLGLTLAGGTGTINGRLRVTTPDNVIRGGMTLRGRSVRARFGAVSMRGDLDLDAHLVGGDLDTSRYNLSGSSLALRNVRVVGGKDSRSGKDDSRSWWATVGLSDGHVSPGHQPFLDASMNVKMRDTVPLITVFSAKKKLPGWVRGILGIKPASGSGRVILGDDTVSVPRLAVKAGAFHLDLRARVNHGSTHAHMLVEWGPFAIGLGLADGKSDLRLLFARKWYAKQPAP